MKWPLFQMWMCRVVVAALLAGLAVAPALSADAATAPEIATPESRLTSQIIEAYGGREAVAAVHSIYTRGFSKVYQQDNEGWITHYFQHTSKLRVESQLHRTPEIRVLNGLKGWQAVGTDSRKEVERAIFEGLLFQYNYMDLPFSLVNGGNALIYRGKDTLGGAAVDVIALKKSEGQEITLYVDAKTHLIAKVSTSLAFGSTMIDMSVELMNYREVMGVKMPFMVVNYFGKTVVSKTTMADVRINQAMDDKLFQP